MKKRILIGLTALFCTACASTPDPAPDTVAGEKPGATERAIQQSQDGFSNAAMSPLEDVNLKRDEIPQFLRTIKNPYKVNPEISCNEIAQQVQRLDGLLGRDWDIPPPDKKALRDQAADGASTAFLDTISSSASGLIPYRGLVRTVTGANSHASKVRKAYERGSHRRTFLKGMGLMKSCGFPAAPLPLPDDVPKVLFR